MTQDRDNQKATLVFIIGGTGQEIPKSTAAIEDITENVEYQRLVKLKEERDEAISQLEQERQKRDAARRNLKREKRERAKQKKTQVKEQGDVDAVRLISQENELLKEESLKNIKALKNEIENLNQQISAFDTDSELRYRTSIYGAYMPSWDKVSSQEVKVKMVRGAKVLHVNDNVIESYEAGNYWEALKQIEFRKLNIRNALDNLFYTSEGKRIRECLLELERDKAKSGSLPDRIVLCGHSRGASACIELARAIYLKYGDQIKIVMNINDPVPGPLRHRESKKIIPPNVESLVITYASHEADKLFTPQDLKEIRYDPDKTSVTTFTLPTTHNYWDENAIRGVNRAMWAAIDNESVDDQLADVDLSEVNEPIDEKNPRAKGKFIAAANSNNNNSLSAFHSKLQMKLGLNPVRINSNKNSATGSFTGSETSRNAKKKELKKVEKKWKSMVMNCLRQTTQKQQRWKLRQFLILMFMLMLILIIMRNQILRQRCYYLIMSILVR